LVKQREDDRRFAQRLRSILCAEASVPTERRPFELRRLLVADEEQELERLSEANVLELGGGGEGFDEVAVVERTAKAWPG
jgi:hypothetical protein